MLIIRSKYNYIDIEKLAAEIGINRELISLRRAEGDGHLWRAWLSNELADVSKKEKDLLWSLICNGHEAVISQNDNKGWRRVLK